MHKEQFKEGDEEADRGNDGKTTSKSGLALNGNIILRKAETPEDGRTNTTDYTDRYVTHTDQMD